MSAQAPIPPGPVTPPVHMMGAGQPKVNKVVPQDGPADAAEGEKLGVLKAVVIFVACTVPTVAMIIALSLMGFGIEVYSAVADSRMNMLGNLACLICAIWLCLAFIFDYHRAAWLWKLTLGVAFAALALAASILKGATYPWAAILFVLGVAPAVLLQMRCDSCHSVGRRPFYRAIGVCCGACTAILLIVWLVWTFTTKYTSDGACWTHNTRDQLIKDSVRIYNHVYSPRALDYAMDCGPGRVTLSDAVEQAEVQGACKRAETVWFVVWMAPFVALLFNFLLTLFCIAQSRFELLDGKEVVGLLQRFVCLLVFLITGIYCSIYASGVSVQLSSAFLAFFTAAIFALVVYTFQEVSQDILTELSLRSPIVKYLGQAYRSDWVRAIGIGGVNVLIPCMLLLDMFRQRVRRCRDPVGTPDGRFTEAGAALVGELSTWKWCSILAKVNLLGEMFVICNVGSKFTFILFSWMNDVLADVNFWLVLVLLFIVSVVLTLLPPVPGSAVFVFAGILIGKLSQAPGGVGFWPGVVIASIIGLMTRLLGATFQYYIGFMAGQNVEVQKLVGVDSVPTRAVEKILRRKGMDLGKVSILVGGPDWPTSVTCGILKLNVFSMLIGIMPIYFASVLPQTLAGALLTKSTTGTADASLWNALKTGTTGLAAVAQAATSLIAAYAITKVIERDYEELSKERPEHAKVAALTKKQAAYGEAFGEVSSWPELSQLRKAVIAGATVLQLISGFVFMLDFALVEPICFRNFEITNEIGAPFKDGGLEGNAINIIRVPVGWANLGIWSIAVCLHLIHNKDIGRAAQRRLQQKAAEAPS